MGRPCTYTAKIARAICERLALGNSLRQICRDDGMPPESTVRLWVIDDRNGFAAQYARARDMGLDVLAEETIEIADDGRNDRHVEHDADGNAVEKIDYDHINRSKLRVAARQWYVSKLAPKKYGDRQDLNVSGELTVTDLFAKAREADA